MKAGQENSSRKHTKSTHRLNLWNGPSHWRKRQRKGNPQPKALQSWKHSQAPALQTTLSAAKYMPDLDPDHSKIYAKDVHNLTACSLHERFVDSKELPHGAFAAWKTPVSTILFQIILNSTTWVGNDTWFFQH